VSAERTSPARGLRIRLFRKGTAFFNRAKAVAWTHQSVATEVTIFNRLDDSFINHKTLGKSFTYSESLFEGVPRKSGLYSTNLRASVFSLKTRCYQAKWSDAKLIFVCFI
jgi:hypothetical protein